MPVRTTLKVSVGILVVAALAGGAAFFLRADGTGEATTQSVTVERRSIEAKALAVGTIEPETEITVKSQVSGVVQHLFVEEGRYVEAGGSLLELRPEPTPLELVEARRALEMREIGVETLRRERDRMNHLSQVQGISERELEQAERGYQEAALELATARDRLELLETGRVSSQGMTVQSLVRAPVSGYVLQRTVEVGDPVVPLSSFQEGTVLMTMADMDRLVFRGTVDEIDVGRLREGMPVTISVGALPGVAMPGTLVRISLKGRTQENATVFPVEIAVQAGDGIRLRAGYSANADILLEQREAVLVVPERVVTFQGDSAWVEVPGPAGDRVRRRIRTGLSDAIHVEVLEGLEEGETVLERPLRTVGR
jgi:HlyD family secretion protein